MKELKLLAAALCLPLLGSVAAPAQKDEHRSQWTWNHSDGGKKLEVRVVNKVEFNDDYSDVSAIPSDGELRVTDTRTPERSRGLLVRRAADGGLEHTYTLNGARQDFDAEAREWLRQVLLRAVRQGGLDARHRVRRILGRRGTGGLLEEIKYIEGDYARRIYFDELLRAEGVRDEDLNAALRDASRTIASDYERAELLLHVADRFLAKNALLPAYFEALDRIGSDYERRRVLAGALRRAGLSREALVATAASAARISSDYEKATFLISAAERYQSDERLRAALRDAMMTIGSDYERGRVQTTLARMSRP